MGRFVIDVVRSDGELVEVQTGGFGALGIKLDALLDEHRMRIVYPVAAERRIVRVDEHGQVLGARRSPKRATVVAVFEAGRVPSLLTHPNLTIEVLLLREDHIRRPQSRTTRGRTRDPGERRLVDVLDRVTLRTTEDIVAVLPALPREPFSSGSANHVRPSRPSRRANHARPSRRGGRPNHVRPSRRMRTARSTWPSRRTPTAGDTLADPDPRSRCRPWPLGLRRCQQTSAEASSDSPGRPPAVELTAPLRGPLVVGVPDAWDDPAATTLARPTHGCGARRCVSDQTSPPGPSSSPPSGPQRRSAGECSAAFSRPAP